MRGGWDALLLIYFVGCGISRLARYNVTASALSDETGKVNYFEGFPIPTSLLLVGGARGARRPRTAGGAAAARRLSIAGSTLHPLALLYGVRGSAMISKTLRIPKP